jgi:dTMP kinase
MGSRVRLSDSLFIIWSLSDFLNVYRTRIEKLLNSGTTVICDRYAFSGIAFSASKVTAAGEALLPFDWCRSPDIGLPAPDLVIFFDITPEIAKERGGFGQERYETEEMQLRVRNFFHRIGEELDEQRENAGEGTRWVSIDAGKGRDEVAEEVWSLVEPLIKRGDHGPLQKLWSFN